MHVEVWKGGRKILQCEAKWKNLLQCVLVTILKGYRVYLGQGHPLTIETRMGEASRINDIGGLGAEGSDQGDTLLQALSGCLTWSKKTSYWTAWLVSPYAHSCACFLLV